MLIKNTAKKVEAMLYKTPILRDDDNRLVANYWYKEIGPGLIDNMSIIDFLTKYSTGQLTSADTITRARRKVQENNPSLRGEKWEDRHTLAQEMKEDIVSW